MTRKPSRHLLDMLSKVPRPSQGKRQTPPAEGDPRTRYHCDNVWVSQLCSDR